MNHIIRRQLLDLVIDNLQQPFDLQNRLSEHYYQTLLPVLEEWFDQLAGEDEVLHIDKLVIDLGAFSTREFEDQLITERLTQKLSSPEITGVFGTASRYSAETHTSDRGDGSRGGTSNSSGQRGNGRQRDGATFGPGHDTRSGSTSGTSEKDVPNASLTGRSGASSGQGTTGTSGHEAADNSGHGAADNSGATSGPGSNSASGSDSTDRSGSVPGMGFRSGADLNAGVGSNADSRTRGRSAGPNDKGPVSFILRRTPGENAFEQWLWYMGKGYLPWNLLRTGKEWEDNVLETLAIDYGAISRLRMILPDQPVTLTRIVRQQDQIFLTKLVGILTSMAQPELMQSLQQLQSPALPLEKLWQDTLLLAATLGREGTTQQLVRRLTHISASPGETISSGTASPGPDIGLSSDIGSPPAEGLSPAAGSQPAVGSSSIDGSSPAVRSSPVDGSPTAAGSSITGSSPADGSSPASTPPPVTGSTSSSSDTIHTGHTHTPIANLTVDGLPDEGLFIGNAGVILTHPFLHHLFKQTGLLANGKFIGGEARQKAIHLIHYLATGRIIAEEFELATAKILCGCPLEEPLEKTVLFTKEELQEADTLLEGLISHWGVKGVTTEGLRGNFLTRNGKLSPKTDKLQLVIEKHAVDILIRTYPFPWNMSIVKLPWQGQPIHLDW